MDALGGVLCRCTGYRKIIAAVLRRAWPPRRRARAACAGPAPRSARASPRARRHCQARPAPKSSAPMSGRPMRCWLRRSARPIRAPASPSATSAPSGAASRPGARSSPPPTFPGRERLRRLSRHRRPAGAGRRRGALPRRGGRRWSPASARRSRARPREFPGHLERAAGARRPVEAQAPGRCHPPRWPDNVLTTGRVDARRCRGGAGGSAHVAVSGASTPPSSSTPISSPRPAVPSVDGDTLVDPRLHPGALHGPRRHGAGARPARRAEVRIVPTRDCGGGFGAQARRLGAAAASALVALKTGRPAALAYTPRRIDDVDHQAPSGARCRRPIGCRCRRAGSPASIFAGDFNTGAYASWGPTVANRVPVHASGPYRDAARTARGRARIHTHDPISGAFRGFGVPQAAIAQETLYDRLADAAGHRPARVPPAERASHRRRHRDRPGAGAGVGHRRMPRGAAAALGARARRGAARTRAGGPQRRGVGVACLLVRLRQHRAAQSLDHPDRHRGRTARSCCTRAPSISARARTPSSPRSPPMRSACRWTRFRLDAAPIPR